jgi:hypothetical protein
VIWPELPYEDWKDTRDTLQLKLQVLGKVRLALTPFEPQWANVPLYVTARGLTTSPMDSAGTIFQADVDLIDHQVVIQTSGGDTRRLALGGGSVADFYAGFMSSLEALGIDVEIRAIPDEVSNPIPFAEDDVHRVYEPVWANRFFVVLSQVDIVMKAHRSRFKGRHTPVHFFWGTFDLAYARYSGPVSSRGDQLTPSRSAAVSGPDMRSSQSLRSSLIHIRSQRGSSGRPAGAPTLESSRSRMRTSERAHRHASRSFNSSKAPMPPGRSCAPGMRIWSLSAAAVWRTGGIMNLL